MKHARRIFRMTERNSAKIDVESGPVTGLFPSFAAIAEPAADGHPNRVAQRRPERRRREVDAIMARLDPARMRAMEAVGGAGTP